MTGTENQSEEKKVSKRKINVKGKGAHPGKKKNTSCVRPTSAPDALTHGHTHTHTSLTQPHPAKLSQA